ncbi:MAG: hypothetical protein AUI90_11945 [Deltaproteobacteria bacterium 13_1_40CM_3_69_14]|nr:MAG: hypothetical protein AUI90_11945 [Deltaproteobacteria bacterium 13_1_40CM_3_69_14]
MLASVNLPLAPSEPYTSSVEICRKRFTRACRAASSSTCVPETFVCTKIPGPRMLRSTWLSAARFRMASTAWWRIRCSTSSALAMSPRTKTCPGSCRRSATDSALPA